MNYKRRIPKTNLQRIEECEEHLFLLWDARRLYSHQKVRYKQIAAELRVLVGDHKPKRRLLLWLMDKYGFVYEVQPPGKPSDKNPIPMVGWQTDPVNLALQKEIEEAKMDEAKMARIIEKMTALRRAIPFSEYVDKALAVSINDYEFSYRDLVLAVAQQVGSSHEDSAIDESLFLLKQVAIGGHESHIARLIEFADLVLEVGYSFITFLASSHAYQPKFLSSAD